jgi:hypothetical protein
MVPYTALTALSDRSHPVVGTRPLAAAVTDVDACIQAHDLVADRVDLS